ncbi:MAG: hypothetical protein M1816_006276 [Peltula sp. TS41687]|nr:MAG: hypothetical protein M1816_006276 [Peltula sp. TS41687]
MLTQLTLLLAVASSVVASPVPADDSNLKACGEGANAARYNPDQYTCYPITCGAPSPVAPSPEPLPVSGPGPVLPSQGQDAASAYAPLPAVGNSPSGGSSPLSGAPFVGAVASSPASDPYGSLSPMAPGSGVAGKPLSKRNDECNAGWMLCPVKERGRTELCGRACYLPSEYGCDNGNLFSKQTGPTPPASAASPDKVPVPFGNPLPNEPTPATGYGSPSDLGSEPYLSGGAPAPGSASPHDLPATGAQVPGTAAPSGAPLSPSDPSLSAGSYVPPSEGGASGSAGTLPTGTDSEAPTGAQPQGQVPGVAMPSDLASMMGSLSSVYGQTPQSGAGSTPSAGASDSSSLDALLKSAGSSSNSPSSPSDPKTASPAPGTPAGPAGSPVDYSSLLSSLGASGDASGAAGAASAGASGPTGAGAAHEAASAPQAPSVGPNKPGKGPIPA